MEENTKKPTLEEILAMAEEHYAKTKSLQMFPSKEAYMAYTRDYFINFIDKMTDDQYAVWVKTNQRYTIERLKSVEKYMEEALKNNKVEPK